VSGTFFSRIGKEEIGFGEMGFKSGGCQRNSGWETRCEIQGGKQCQGRKSYLTPFPPFPPARNPRKRSRMSALPSNEAGRMARRNGYRVRWHNSDWKIPCGAGADPEKVDPEKVPDTFFPHMTRLARSSAFCWSTMAGLRAWMRWMNVSQKIGLDSPRRRRKASSGSI
jgi:hypothetical protein